METKQFKIRKLKFKDTFTFSRILDKCDLTFDKVIELKKVVENHRVRVSGGVGLDTALIVIEVLSKFHKAEKEITEFFASLVGLSYEEFEALTHEDIYQIISQVFGVEKFENFMQFAKDLLTTKTTT